MGNMHYSFVILSQENVKGAVDWREVPNDELKIYPAKLPDKISRFCTEMLKKLGLVFGCFDFIVNNENEYVFLEVNQQGQFLWQEFSCPEVPLLDYFCQFLVADNFFDWNPKAGRSSVISLSESREFKNLYDIDYNFHIQKT